MMADGKKMACYEAEYGGYAVRPKEWQGLFKEGNILCDGWNVTALFTNENEARNYCYMCNDPLAFSLKTLRGELKKRGDLWDAFLVCIESAIKENNLPFTPESEIAERVLERIADVNRPEGTIDEDDKPEESETGRVKRENDILRADLKRLYEQLDTEHELLRQRNEDYQDDCIQINRLTTTIDVLLERFAAHTGER